MEGNKSIDSFDESIIVCKLFYHIEHPCGAMLDGKRVHLRDFYLREAKRILPELKNDLLKEGLSKLVAVYDSD